MDQSNEHSLRYVSLMFDQVLEKFKPIIKLHFFGKNETIKKKGDIGQELFFVKSGILRVYYFKDIKDITANFAFKGGAITAPDSVIHGVPSKYVIEALEDSYVYSVNRADLDVYLEQKPYLERLAREFTQAVYLELLDRVESIMFTTAHERYEALATNYPELIQKANLGYIASYLGITQETLSRIRAALSK